MTAKIYHIIFYKASPSSKSDWVQNTRETTTTTFHIQTGTVQKVSSQAQTIALIPNTHLYLILKPYSVCISLDFSRLASMPFLPFSIICMSALGMHTAAPHNSSLIQKPGVDVPLTEALSLQRLLWPEAEDTGCTRLNILNCENGLSERACNLW